jgi:hypothetical protein
MLQHLPPQHRKDMMVAIEVVVVVEIEEALVATVEIGKM